MEAFPIKQTASDFIRLPEERQEKMTKG